MNKQLVSLTILIIGFLGIFMFSSCTKEFTCKCELVYSGNPGLPEPKQTEYSITDTRSKAESLCESKSGTYEKDGITTVETCKLW